MAIYMSYGVGYIHTKALMEELQRNFSMVWRFMFHVDRTPIMYESGKMFCPCRKCKNTKNACSKTVRNQLVNRGFFVQQ